MLRLHLMSLLPRSLSAKSETQKKRALLRRMVFLHGFLFVLLLLILARLIELQILNRTEYAAAAQSQHFGGVVLPAQRGEILALNSKSGETTILATNTTLDLVYVDPLITDNPTVVAEMLSDELLTEEYHELCTKGSDDCPRELISFYAAAYDPLALVGKISSGALLEPIPSVLPTPAVEKDKLPDLTEARRLFARDIESRISGKRVTFTPIKYGATKVQMNEVRALALPGVGINWDAELIYANPEETGLGNIATLARKLGAILEVDASVVQPMLRSRPLRYVPVMRRLPPRLSLQLKERMLASMKETDAKRAAAANREEAAKILDPLRSIALIPEHWRFYPDGTIASQVVGFLNTNQEAQYGIERTMDPVLRGQEGLISTVSDPLGGQILTADQKIIDPKDGDKITLSIDPFIQKQVEAILAAGAAEYDADSGQAIVMEPYTGRIIAMVNVPLFERNSYASVYEKVPLLLPPEKQKEIVVEIYHPETNIRIVKAYADDIFTPEGRKALPEATRKDLEEMERLYDLHDYARYYLYLGENLRREIFPTDTPLVWLKFRNNVGVGAYLNRSIQEIYEPGSVMKPITMAIAIDQGEVTASTIYDDKEDVKVDDFTIRNALLINYGKVTMTNCLEFSINTCMTNVSERLGKKLFQEMLSRFGFGHITGIELEDELPGLVPPWRQWSNALRATAAFGQGVSATPLQMITAFAALSNGGQLMRPTIIDSITHADGTVEKVEPKVIDQVIKPETSQTITAMLVSAVEHGYAAKAQVPGHRIAGKTGTSQIAGPGGRYETGTGSTIATFMGYAPADHPRFIVLVKFDRPKRGYIVHGSATAAPVFSKIATFLFEYYGLPPDKL